MNLLITLTVILAALIALRYTIDHLRRSKLELLMIQFIANPTQEALMAVDEYEEDHEPLRQHVQPVVLRRFISMRLAFQRLQSLTTAKV